MADEQQPQPKVVVGIEGADRVDEIVGTLFGQPRVFDDDLTAAAVSEDRAGVSNVRMIGELAQSGGPGGVGRPDQQSAFEPALQQCDPFETVRERTLVEKQFGTQARGTI